MLGEAISTDIMGPLNIPTMSTQFGKYFISFIDAHSRYLYVQPFGRRYETAGIIQTYLTKVENAFRRTPQWLISDNVCDYMSTIVEEILGDMEVTHIPVIPYNSEENVIAERFNRTIMNAVHAALLTAVMSWEYWKCAIIDDADKYNQLPHGATGKSPQQIWYQQAAPDLSNLFIFAQLGFVPVLNKVDRSTKYKNMGQLVRYLGQDAPKYIFAETTDGSIQRYRSTTLL